MLTAAGFESKTPNSDNYTLYGGDKTPRPGTLIEAFIWARVPGDRVHHAGQVWQQAGSMVAGGDAERLTGHISLPSKKQGAGTEVVCCLQTLQDHLQGHTSPNKAAP